MGEVTSIAWTDATFNPWWGCTKVSAGCEHCYAETFAKRTGGAWWGPQAQRRGFGDKHWNGPEKWDRDAAKLGARSRVFCGSMCDVFEDREDLGVARTRLWHLVGRTPHLDWLLLTKRPENIAPNLPALWGDGWPNVWLGTSVEGPETVHRIETLRRVPAAVRFISAEPLVGPWTSSLDAIHWLIVGGESGPRARPMDVEWARALRDCAGRYGAAFFMKQLGGRGDKRDRLDDFPANLQIRQFPRSPGGSR